MKTRTRSALRWPLASLLTIAIGLTAVSVKAEQALSQEEKLSAIRQGLVQAAIDGPTKVQSMAWIDDKGALREISSFRTGMQVRGVRVLSYQRDSQGQPVADLRWQALAARPADSQPSPATDPKPGVAPPACKAAPSAGRLQHVIGLTIAAAPDWTVDELPAIRLLENQLPHQWRGAADGAVVWRLAPSTAGVRSAYENALLGSSADQMPWQARLSLRPLSRPSPWLLVLPHHVSEGTLVAGIAPEGLMQLDFSLTARNQHEPLFEARSQIRWRTDRSNWEAPRLSDESQELLAMQLQNWSQQIRQRLACEPVLPEVISNNRDGVRINAGALAGVRVGDEWLLADGRSYMQQILEPAVVAQSVLAKVQSVSEHHAQLQLIAGPQTLVQRTWRAWPAETLR